MPLVQGNSKEAISQNYKTELDAGRSKSQALAIALHTANPKKKN